MFITILVIVLVFALLGGAVPYGGYSGAWHGYGLGAGVPSVLGLVLILLLILALTGRF